MPGDSFAIENPAVMPVPNQHVFDSQLMQQLHLLRTIWVAYHPIGLGIGEVVVMKYRYVLDSDNRVVSFPFQTLFMFKVRQPCEHFLRLVRRLRRQGGWL